ncbi:MAG: hypothetical protein MR425_01350 [Lachnospiraceae bacterium]|nr:hypothetical protein [Lachnospiraceae bacterium]
MFGRKKESGIPVMHYEGIEEFATDYPYRIELKDDLFEIRRIKPETTVTLPLNRIKSFSTMEEEKFMLKYHGQAKNTSKMKGVNKYYLVVEYDKGILAFWGTAKEYKYFITLQYATNSEVPSHIEL